ncbi:MAG: NAD(P)/FAD-dependent oxidoreductase [Gammaproteobacteria bacterium]|nr:NAD(P)/FAD-dependent oxidoreductase [Gammaproteobacteria bacterium]MYK82610.1 NAD(P)/FAD-dependent oxidoreductase [Gammaproteobacteria bacterium]
MTGSNKQYDAIIIGSGFGGMYALHHLRDKMGKNVRAFDGASGVGGTWWYNRYPGARVDAPSSPFYAYTFSQELVNEWDWKETQTAGPDVLAYLEHVAARFDLLKDIQFDTWVTDACYDEAAQRWTINTSTGESATAQFLVCAVGALFVANLPDYPGIDDFAGECYHTGRWPHERVSFEGKRVGVIGTGSSGIQSIPEIAKEAEHVTVFQRTPQYSLPARNRPLSSEELTEARENWEDLRACMCHRGGVPFKITHRRAADATPEEREALYEALWETGGIDLIINSYAGVMSKKELNDEVSEFVRNKIREIVRDPETAAKLMPDYYIGTKRIILDNGYFETYNRDNVSLVDLREDPIQEFTPTSVRTQDGEHPIDILVLATGFDAVTGSMLNLNPKGRGGVSLQQKWGERFDNYLGTTIAGFPNLFMIHGPGSPGVFFTMPLGGERTTAWIAGCISHLEEAGLGAMEATEDAEKAWDGEVNDLANRTLHPFANSWYMGANVPGKPRQFLGYLLGTQYFKRLNEVAEEGYEGFEFEPVHAGAMARASSSLENRVEN